MLCNVKGWRMQQDEDEAERCEAELVYLTGLADCGKVYYLDSNLSALFFIDDGIS
jgi:hypothetical protein